MRNERHYVTINYNKKNKERIAITFYTVVNNGFSGQIVNNLTYKYNNLYHMLKNENKRIEKCEAETNCEVLEGATKQDVLNAYNNMYFIK